MTAKTYLDLKEAVILAGYEEEITWAETVNEMRAQSPEFIHGVKRVTKSV